MSTVRDSDSSAMRRAAFTVSRRVAIVSALGVLVIAILAVAFLLKQSKPKELLDADADQHRIYIDAFDMIGGIIALGVIAIVLAAVASWTIARSAVRPLGDALRLQRSFVADASHELRTPLTVLDARIQLLQRRPPDPPELGAALAGLRRDTRNLIDVVTDLLLITESAAGTFDREAADGAPIDQVLAETADDMALLADARSVHVLAEVTTSARVRVPATSLRRVMVALVQNAIVHTPSGGTVEMAARVVGKRAEIVVTDTGTGIADRDRDRVFDRFARGTDAESSDASGRRGFGIGLSLVRDVVERHGGRVEVAETSAAGTTMRLDLPLL